jgi:phosphatidylglycerophosphatase A
MLSIKRILRYLNRFIVTGFYSGYIPGAPGTYGSLLAAIMVVYLPILTDISLIVVLFVTGEISAQLEEKYTGLKDEGKIVIDEMVGVFITFFGIALDPLNMIAGFLLFRFFDILKPSLIDKTQRLPGGWGVMTDDVAAGLVSNIVLRVLLLIL